MVTACHASVYCISPGAMTDLEDVNLITEKTRLHLAHQILHSRAPRRTSPARTGVREVGVHVALIVVPGGTPVMISRQERYCGMPRVVQVVE